MTGFPEASKDQPVWSRLVPTLVVLTAFGAGTWLLFFDATPPSPELPLSAPAIPETTPAETTFPEADIDSEAVSEAPPAHIPAAQLAVTLPSLAESDTEVREHLRALTGDGPLASWLSQGNLVQRMSALIAALARGEFSPEALLLEPPPGGFQVDVRDGITYTSPRNYPRYNRAIGLIDGLDVIALTEFFQRYRPLLEAAYGELGQPPEQLDTALLGAIDHLLATPELAEPPELAQESVAYTYADPKLEGLSTARKQLLRVGPSHLRTLKAKLTALRTALLATPPDAAPTGATPVETAPTETNPASKSVSGTAPRD
jgi:hypothetical protein